MTNPTVKEMIYQLLNEYLQNEHSVRKFIVSEIENEIANKGKSSDLDGVLITLLENLPRDSGF